MVITEHFTTKILILFPEIEVAKNSTQVASQPATVGFLPFLLSSSSHKREIYSQK
jgi:hypothetical protein